VSELPAIVTEAAKKAAVTWLTVPGVERAYAVWCRWLDGALYVVTGPGEQPAPGLDTATSVDVSLRGDHGGRVVTFPAAVDRVRPDSEEWKTVLPQLVSKRLNTTGPAEQTGARWAAECLICRLTPADGPIEAGATLPDASGAAPPPPTPAANRTARPFRLHRVRQPKS
jgi:hypothetical protein